MMFTRAAHLSDGELLRLLDADGSSDELARFEAHATACHRCAAGLRSLRHAVDVVHVGIAAIDVPDAAVAGAGPARDPRPARAFAQAPAPAAAPTLWHRGWARAAIVLLALAGALVGVQPLRARIRGWVVATWIGVLGQRSVAARPQPAAPPAPLARPALWFRPAGPELRVVVAARQSTGQLVVQPSAEPAASLEIVPGDAAVVPLASERLLEIGNTSASRSSYVLRLPRSLQRVVVRVGDQAETVLGAPALAAGVRLDLAGPPRPAP